MRKIRIGDRLIGDGEPCFIIAEAGSNHDGSLAQAKKLIDVAVKSKADAVKFQLFRSEKLYSKGAGNSDYLGTRKQIGEIIKGLEMPYNWIEKLAGYCEKKGVFFLVSVFDEESVDRLDEYVLAHKIASYEVSHIPLLKYVARKNKPMIISTGASTLSEVVESLDAVYSTGNRKVCLTQCTAKYPAPQSSMNLRVIVSMKRKFRIPVGLSDHSREPLVAPLAAVALGANILEKHFTLDNDLLGPDHRFSLEPHELADMVKKIRMVEEALGSGRKKVEDVERELYDFAKRRIHATKDIKRGEQLLSKNVAVLRSGKNRPGLEPKHIEKIWGKKAKRDIRAGEGITWSMLS
ncbi:MAG: N-acetylneuraminate synthase family protein [Candidatus Altiarchaeota archaeon]|nr:N-acetylneuraminate synthase family protein [Candidatus Altiarchaeota archaeon]